MKPPRLWYFVMTVWAEEYRADSLQLGKSRSSGSAPGSGSCRWLQRGREPLSVSLSRLEQPWALHALILCVSSFSVVLKTRHVPVFYPFLWYWKQDMSLSLTGVFPGEWKKDRTTSHGLCSHRTLTIGRTRAEIYHRQVSVGFLNCKIRNLLTPEKRSNNGLIMNMSIYICLRLYIPDTVWWNQIRWLSHTHGVQQKLSRYFHCRGDSSNTHNSCKASDRFPCPPSCPPLAELMCRDPANVSLTPTQAVSTAELWTLGPVSTLSPSVCCISL